MFTTWMRSDVGGLLLLISLQISKTEGELNLQKHNLALQKLLEDAKLSQK